ncbi:MAG: antitoxin [Alphaproteobacteria bacterium 41-28]|nr:MAG: antitoxin [Alphaproteobacteria bacterium 41-28]
MDAITYTQARKNFTLVMNRVCEDHVPLIITRQAQEPVVMLSLEDYNAIEETLYLFRSPRNAQRLLESIQEAERNEFVKMDLSED